MARKYVLATLIAAFPATAALGQVTLFTSLASFEAALADANKVLKGIDDFEEGNIGPGGFAGTLADPLEFGVPNLGGGGVGYPDGLSLPGLAIQSNNLGTSGAPAG